MMDGTCVCMQVWLFLFGWELTMLLAVAAMVQCLTVIGIPTTMTLTEFMKFTLWYGHSSTAPPLGPIAHTLHCQVQTYIMGSRDAPADVCIESADTVSRRLLRLARSEGMQLQEVSEQSRICFSRRIE